MVELHVHTLFSLQLMVFSYFPAAYPAHSWQDQKSLSCKVNWAGLRQIEALIELGLWQNEQMQRQLEA